MVLTIRVSNILWAHSPDGYRTVIGKHTVYNENVMDYKTSQYTTTLLNVFSLKQETILSAIAAFLQSEPNINITVSQAKRKLGKPCFRVNCADKGNIIWNNTGIKDLNGTPVTVICNITKDTVDSIECRFEESQKESKFRSLIRFLNKAEIKTCK